MRFVLSVHTYKGGAVQMRMLRMLSNLGVAGVSTRSLSFDVDRGVVVSAESLPTWLGAKLIGAECFIGTGRSHTHASDCRRSAGDGYAR